MPDRSEEDALRAARNESLYREINENIKGLNEAFAEILDASSTWLCECADADCAEAMEMTTEEYEQVRAHPSRFAVLRGHLDPVIEEVIAEHPRYVVVQKIGAGEAFAAAHDPRRIAPPHKAGG
jgi:hypothetical protein